MKKKIFFFLFVFFCAAVSAQIKYSGVFAPAEDWIKSTEKPYRDAICLNGTWQFQPVALPQGFKEGVDDAPELKAPAKDAWDKTMLRVPSPWNVNSFADRNGLGGDFRCYPSYPKAWENAKMGWLRKKIAVPQNWKGKQLLLHFEAVAGDAQILVNGKIAGNHFGIFLPFDIDVTNLLEPGKENEILIGVRKASLFDKRSDYGRRTYQAGSFWGQHIAGIWQDVFLVAVSGVHVEVVYVQSKLDEGELTTDITLRNDGENEATVSLSGDISPWKATDIVANIKAVTVNIPARSSKTITLSHSVRGALKEWWPQSPNLYGLNIRVAINNKIVDNKYTRFGWRQTQLKGSQFLLNGKPFSMRGDSWHFMGIPQMTRRYAEAWYKAMRDANLNTVRLHAQPYPAFYLDVADEMGILVLDESAMWASDGGPKLGATQYWLDSEKHMEELVKRDRNHPSVIGWSVSNEIKPVIREVMHNPPGVMEILVEHYEKWAAICRKYDPSRPWISADGEDDGEGKLPVYIVHYGGVQAMERGEKSGKPWGVGEAGNAYYGTPEQVAETNGDEAYTSFYGRMRGVAASSYQSLRAQKEKNAVYRSVFNLVWYGLKPLPLGLKDTTRPPAITDGIFFTAFKEGVRGVQPERLGPYSSTLNPGFDPGLPLYQTWPLFDAIKDAGSDKPVPENKWKSTAKQTVVIPVVKPVTTGFAGNTQSGYVQQLKKIGVRLDTVQKVPGVLFVDPANITEAGISQIKDVYKNKGTVVIWGIDSASLKNLNNILPAELTLTKRAVNSMLPGHPDPVTAGITNADLYFSELKPAEITSYGLDGKIVKQSSILLAACNTDWTLWNKQPEYAKTGMILRSERETKPSGVTMIAKKMGNGRLILTTIPVAPRQAKAEKLVRRLLENLGVGLGAGGDSIRPLSPTGEITHALVLGSYATTGLQAATDTNWVSLQSGESMRLHARLNGKQWQLATAENAVFDLTKGISNGPRNNAVAYMSLWLFSPRPWDDLLIEPNVPVVNLELSADDAAQVWLNGNRIVQYIRQGSIDGRTKAEGLKLHQGWNHLLVKVINVGGAWKAKLKLSCNQPEFLTQLQSALEKP